MDRVACQTFENSAKNPVPAAAGGGDRPPGGNVYLCLPMLTFAYFSVGICHNAGPAFAEATARKKADISHHKPTKADIAVGIFHNAKATTGLLALRLARGFRMFYTKWGCLGEYGLIIS